VPTSMLAECSVPPRTHAPADTNLTEALFAHERGHPDAPLLSVDTGGGWHDLTAREVVDRVRAIAAGLIASGIEPGDRVALLSRTRLEWTLCDYAIWSAGGVTVPIYETSSSEQIEWILSDSGAKAVFCEQDGHLAAIEALLGGLDDLGSVWCFDRGDLDGLAASGAGVSPADVDARRAVVGLDDLASIVYTSGTTGRPKGCRLTHGNCLAELYGVLPQLDVLFGPETSTLLFLPLAHIFGRAIQIACVTTRTRMGFCADTARLVPALQSFRPTFILAVPRVFEKVYNSAKHQAHRDVGGGPLGAVRTTLTGRIFDDAESAAVAWSEAAMTKKRSVTLEARHALFERLVYAKLRAAMGGRVTHAVSAGGPLGARLGHFFHGAGVTVLEAYGLTETMAATFNWPTAMKIGSVGRPIPGDTIRIAEDGEVLIRGANVFAGYWRNDEATAATFAGEWFKSGDIGELDADGYLTITGRKKELIVTAAGKNVAPAVLEDRIRAHPMVSQCMVVGDNKPFIGCLVTIDADAWPSWAGEHGKGTDLSDHVDDDDLRAEVQLAVDDANRAVSRAEAIRKFVILPTDFSEETGEITPTLKLKRSVVADNWADAIAGLYR
jgi:long-chain acyl-CoA synthetase